MGIIPYQERFERSHLLAEALELPMDTEVTLAGRVMLMRNMGKLTFAHIQDQSGKIQIALQKDDLGDQYKFFNKYIDLADFIGVKGKMFTTHKGEISVLVEEFILLSKTMRSLPEKFHGITDQEKCYRQRYLDLVTNRDTMDRFLFRSKVIKSIRSFLEGHNFVEVETPILSTIPSGAAAKPFHTHHNALDFDLTLRIAPENFLKRCIAGGFDRVFEFAKCFRNEGLDPSHLQEFTMLEYYGSYWNFEDNMQFTEKMFEHFMMELFGTMKIEVYGREIDFTAPWPRVDYRELILNDSGIDFAEHKDVESLRAAIKEKGIVIEDIEKYGYGNLVDALYKKVSRPKLIDPCFVINHPIHTKPLARKNDENPEIADTFQLLVNTWEIINAYSELVDPQDQRERFAEQANAKAGGDEEAMEYDEDYVVAMEHGMPPISGWGMGIDRLVALLTSQENLKDCVLFPIMKPLNYTPNEEVSQAVAASFSEEAGSEYYNISKDVEQKFPGLKIGFAKIEGVDIKEKDDGLEKLKVSETPSPEDAKKLLDESEVLKYYREMFKGFGIDPTKKKPSSIALLDRVADGKPLYTINTLVDAANIVVMKYGVSLGVFDYDNISFPVFLRFAEDGEEFLPLMEKKAKKLKAGELIYADTEKVQTRDFDYRDSDHTKITTKTKNVALVVDGVEPVSEELARQILDETVELIQKFNGGEVTHKELNGQAI